MNRLLSDSMISQLPPVPAGKRYYDVWDRRTTGLFVRISKRKRVFYFYTSETKKTKKLGDFATFYTTGLNVQQARELANSDSPINFDRYLTLEDYITKQYAKDRTSLGKPVSDATIKNILSIYHDVLHVRLSMFDQSHLVLKLEQWRNGTHTLQSTHHTQKNKQAKKVSSATLRKRFVILNAVFNTLVSVGRLNTNPLRNPGLKQPAPLGISTYEINYADAVNFLLNHQCNVSLEARLILSLIILHGLRDSEVLKNYASNFVLEAEEPYLVIPPEITKTGKGRTVPIVNDQLLTALRAYKANHSGKLHMFVNKSTQKPYTAGICRKLYSDFADHFKLEQKFGTKRKYDFRHTFASKLYHATGDIKLVADTIGDSIETTNKYYASVNSKKVREAIGNLD